MTAENIFVKQSKFHGQCIISGLVGEMEDGGVGECEPSIWLLDPPRRASSCAASPPTAVHAGLSAAGLAAGRRVPRWMCAGPRSHAQRRRV